MPIVVNNQSDLTNELENQMAFYQLPDRARGTMREIVNAAYQLGQVETLERVKGFIAEKETSPKADVDHAE